MSTVIRPSFRNLFALIVFALALPGMAIAKKDEIAASSATNPPPVEPLAAFARYEVRPLVIAPAYAGHKANEAARVNLQANLDERLAPVLESTGTGGEGGRTLLIEPRIEKIRYIGTGARVWAGAFAGKSRVLLRVRLTDAATGALIAEPEFYQHAAGMAGAYSFGGADKAMLERAASLVADYLVANRDAAVGGRTGGE